jgi:hypothetical protein
MAAQHSTVKNISVHFWHPIDFDFLDLRSQHRVNKYNKNPISERISAAAGIDANMPKLCNEIRKKQQQLVQNGQKQLSFPKKFDVETWLFHFN